MRLFLFFVLDPSDTNGSLVDFTLQRLEDDVIPVSLDYIVCYTKGLLGK